MLLSLRLAPTRQRARGAHHSDRAVHGANLDSRARALAAIHLERRATLGVDPKLVLVFDLAGPVAPSSLRAAGLTVLGGTQGSAVLRSPMTRSSTHFSSRAGYRDAEADIKYAPNEGFVDVLSNIRLYAAQDRLTRRLRQRGEQADGADPLDLQIDLWHPGDRALAEAWIRETADAVLTAGGNVRDRYVNHRSGLLLIRATVPAAAVAELAEIDESR